ncbi:MAG: hypothetical protein AB7G93_15325 [Bdellovibrionales bacterium]
MQYSFSAEVLRAGGSVVQIIKSRFSLVIVFTYTALVAVLPTAEGGQTRSAIVQKVVLGPLNSWFTYTHSNGFYPSHSNSIVVAQSIYGTDGRVTNKNLVSFDLASAEQKFIRSKKTLRMYYSVSETGLAAVAEYPSGAIILLDLKNLAAEKVLYTPASGFRTSEPDITRDGRFVLFGETNVEKIVNGLIKGPSRLLRINTQTGALEELTRFGHTIDHTHFFPFNESWASFCNVS